MATAKTSAEKKTITRSGTGKILETIIYKEAEFSSGVLPTRRNTLKSMLYLLYRVATGQNIKYRVLPLQI